VSGRAVPFHLAHVSTTPAQRRHLNSPARERRVDIVNGRELTRLLERGIMPVNVCTG
jgi:hypothetical protein